MSSPLLVADAVHKTYQMGRVQLEVLRGCTLRVEPGEFVAIMGKSGSGKSTLLHLLGALDVPTRGDVVFEGESVNRPRGAVATPAEPVRTFLSRYPWLSLLLHLIALVVLAGVPGFLLWWQSPLPWSELAQLLTWLIAVLFIPLSATVLFRPLLAQLVDGTRVAYRRHVFGFVFQFYHLLPELTVLENVLLARQVGSSILGWFMQRAAARDDALAMIARVGLSERLRHRPNELSGGERQRVAIARALVHKPRILFADEPTGNLDAEAGASLMALLKELHNEGQTIVMVTHDPGVAAQADRTLVLEQGRLRAV
jgi:ABC-type lipoprotein export system ATPase subunit